VGKILKSVAVVIVLLSWCLSVHSQGTTSKGTEFWTAYMGNTNPPVTGQPQPSVMVLYITSDVNTSGVVNLADGSFSQAYTVNANKITIINIPSNAFLSIQGVFKKGIHITALEPVAVYAHIFAENSSGATLLLPVSTLGRDYYTINYTQQANEPNSYSEFMVIATEDNTTVNITPAAALLDGKQAATTFQVTLNKGEVYQGQANTDLTGTRITSVSAGTNTCTKIAVFSGSGRVYIGCTPVKSNGQLINNSSDNLFQQVYPTASWGKNYITVPLKGRGYDIFRVVLSTPSTIVKVNGTLINAADFINGSYYEFSSTATNIITANKPIQVVQYAVTEGDNITCGVNANDIGDPEMIYLTPLEQTIDHVTLYSASNYAILKSFINVIIKTSAVPSFMIDGKHYSAFTTIPGNTVYSYAQIPVSSGSSHVINAGTGFNAIAYGFGDKESYGYAAGTNLQDLNSFVALQQPGSTILQANGCTGILYNLVLTLPYVPISLTWDLKNGTAPITLNNPSYTTVQKDGGTLYLFTYPGKPAMYKIGNYTALATVISPNVDICNQLQQYKLDYKVSDPPIADFMFSDACLGDGTAFTDNSTIYATTSAWLWDFGDGQTSNLQNPVHNYSEAGKYTVNMTITDIDGCTSTKSLPVTIYPKPTAGFAIKGPACINNPAIFTDRSAISEGNIIKWVWDFGDGDIETFTAPTPTVSHTYTKLGTNTVTLTVTSDNDCISPVFSLPVTVNPLPIADFSLPDICQSDAFAQFTNKSTIADNTEADFTYLWNFGDPNANASNPNTSTQKNPKHIYTNAADYNVTLTVQSKYGCSYTKTQQFTVNGANPVASFTIENNNSCSSDAVIFNENSSVDFGNITRLVWYFDYNNNPTDSTVYTRENMPADRKYSHSYGIFNTGNTQNHEVRLVAYSGNSVASCSNIKDAIVTQIVNPVVTLVPVNDICQGANPIQLTADTKGFKGTGVYGGPGVSPTGIFNPAIAGPGTATVNYTFTSNGCSYTTSKQINVIADPTVTVDAVVNMLEGDPITLKASATGNSLTYKWTPSTGLNHDNILNPVVNAIDNTTYTLTVTSADNCTAQASVKLLVKKKLVIPNAFTPNGDGINDTWKIKYIENYPGCTVDIFNRFGEKLYSSVNYMVEWDGTYKGSYLPAGTYYYIIDPKNGRTTVSGSVTIIR
jgi:gliding motility-associated-like protein